MKIYLLLRSLIFVMLCYASPVMADISKFKIPLSICNMTGAKVEDINVSRIMVSLIGVDAESAHLSGLDHGACQTKMIVFENFADRWFVSFKVKDYLYFSSRWKGCTIAAADTGLPVRLDLYLDHYNLHMYKQGSFSDTGCNGNVLLHSNFKSTKS
jgi:hypothetical protein